MSGCCPPEALPYLQSEGENKGEKVKTGDCEFYSTGSKGNSKVMVIIPDVYGWDSGRVRKLGDHFAETAGYQVCIPKLLGDPPHQGGTDGDALPPDFEIASRREEFQGYMKEHPFTKQEPKLRALLDYLLTEDSDKEIYLLGCCWGGYVIAEMMASEDLSKRVVAGAGMHPSVGIAGLYSKDDLEIVKAMKVPVLWLPTKGDSDDYREGGKLLTASPPGSTFIDYPTVSHGFFTRGDSKDEVVAMNVEKGVADILAFFANVKK